MLRSISKSLWLLMFGVVLVCGIYPAILWGIGQTFFPFQSNGSVLKGPDGKAVGSLLIAQPFTQDEYFWPRPSAASYDGTAGTSSALAVSNYALRDRVARMIGPIAVYSSGAEQGQPVWPDVDAWFTADKFAGQTGIVAQWADAHNELAQGWVTADPTHAASVAAWAKAHPDILAQYVKDNPGTPHPMPSDLAVVFFENFSKDHPGTFPCAVAGAGGQTTITPTADCVDIRSVFFDMWRQDHPNAPLANLPGDYVTTSGSGLDPDITLENAEYQLDRVADKWAQDLKRDPSQIRQEIQSMLQVQTFRPAGGLFGGPLINVLKINLALRTRYGSPS
jgi:potassium-transporting ATPase KdpC subunit